MLRLLVCTSFQDLFHPPTWGTFHLSLAVLVHYRSLNLFRLGRWSSQIQAGLHVSDPTQDTPTTILVFPYGTITHCGVPFQRLLVTRIERCWSPTTPSTSTGFGLIPFRSSLLGESQLISFPQVLRYFSSLCILYPAYIFSRE